METKNKTEMNSKNNIFLIVGTILVLAISRLLPHPYNFTPLVGIAVLGATYFQSSIWKYVVPVVAFYVSDLLVTNLLYASYYPGQGFVWFTSHMAWTYGATLAIVLISSVIMRKKSLKNLAGASFAGAVIFFLISNFGSWLADPMYPKSIGGLTTAYVAGIPFFPATLASAFVYAGLGYGIIEFGSSRMRQSVVGEV